MGRLRGWRMLRADSKREGGERVSGGEFERKARNPRKRIAFGEGCKEKVRDVLGGGARI